MPPEPDYEKPKTAGTHPIDSELPAFLRERFSTGKAQSPGSSSKLRAKVDARRAPTTKAPSNAHKTPPASGVAPAQPSSKYLKVTDEVARSAEEQITRIMRLQHDAASDLKRLREAGVEIKNVEARTNKITLDPHGIDTYGNMVEMMDRGQDCITTLDMEYQALQKQLKANRAAMHDHEVMKRIIKQARMLKEKYKDTAEWPDAAEIGGWEKLALPSDS